MGERIGDTGVVGSTTPATQLTSWVADPSWCSAAKHRCGGNTWMLPTSCHGSGHALRCWRNGGGPRNTSLLVGTMLPWHGCTNSDLNSTYVFLQRLFQEVADDFATSSIFHAGGDEVSTACWEANAEVSAWMASRGMNATQLLSHYMQRLFRIVEELELTPASGQRSCSSRTAHRRSSLVAHSTLEPGLLCKGAAVRVQ